MPSPASAQTQALASRIASITTWTRLEPQPRDAPVRPPQSPLRDARITKFARDEEHKTYTME